MRQAVRATRIRPVRARGYKRRANMGFGFSQSVGIEMSVVRKYKYHDTNAEFDGRMTA